MNAAMDKQQLLRRLDKAWIAFKDSYAGLSESEILEPGVTKAWSVRDIIAHVTTWEEEALKHLPAVLEGRRPPRYSVTYGGIDAFNAAQARGDTFSAVLTDLGMPHVDGRQVAIAVKRASSSTPVIMLTGWGQGLDAHGDTAMPVDEILSKPPKLRDLRQALARHVRMA